MSMIRRQRNETQKTGKFLFAFLGIPSAAFGGLVGVILIAYGLIGFGLLSVVGALGLLYLIFSSKHKFKAKRLGTAYEASIAKL